MYDHVFKRKRLSEKEMRNMNEISGKEKVLQKYEERKEQAGGRTM